jgi:hypothetical protein
VSVACVSFVCMCPHDSGSCGRYACAFIVVVVIVVCFCSVAIVVDGVESFRVVKKQYMAYLNGKPRFVHWCHMLVLHKWFDTFIIMVIVANTVTLSMDHYMMSPELEDNLSNLNRVFTAVFASEMAFKLIGESSSTRMW